MKQERFRLVIQVPASWMEHVDRHRGDRSRSEYLRATIHRSLNKCEAGVERRRDNRGVYDRVSRGLASPETAEKILRRKRHAQVMREWRASHPDAPKRPKKVAPAVFAPEVRFTFHPTGQITSSDLDPLATFVGLVDDRGIYLPESHRYSIDRVRQELLQQMESEPGHAWGERYRLFVAQAPSL